jgi:hypothetical protein
MEGRRGIHQRETGTFASIGKMSFRHAEVAEHLSRRKMSNLLAGGLGVGATSDSKVTAEPE